MRPGGSDLKLRKETACDPLPEGCGLDDNLYSSRQLAVSGERIVDVNGGIILRLADIRDDIDFVFLERPRRRPSGPKNASSRSVSLGSDAERSRGVVIIPGVPGNKNVRRVGGHGRNLGVLFT